MFHRGTVKLSPQVPLPVVFIGAFISSCQAANATPGKLAAAARQASPAITTATSTEHYGTAMLAPCALLIL